MRKSLLVLGTMALLTPAFADDTTPPPPAPAQPSASDEAMLDQTTCRKLPPPTGSRLGARQICLTNRQWRDQQDQSQKTLRASQRQFGVGPGGGS